MNNEWQNISIVPKKQKDIQEAHEDWKKYTAPTLEITTIIPQKGCVVDCVFCPQRILERSYKGTRSLSLENFKKLLDKVPNNVRITFAGFVEPWLNKYATDMVLHAHEKGHPISVFTTGVGLDVEDMERMVHIPFAGDPNGGFTLHLPDSEMLAKHPITPKFIKLMEWFKNNNHRIQNFNKMSMGAELHPEIKPYFSEAPTYEMWSRAGNLMHETMLKPELLNVVDRWKAAYHEDKNRTCGCIEHLYHNVLLPNGDVSLCCMDYGLEYILGNLFESEYNQIVPKEQSCFDICNLCENGVNPKVNKKLRNNTNMKIDKHGLVKYVLESGGSIHPLVLPSQDTNGTGTFNPSIYNDNGKLLMNFRHCQVTIYHSELNKFEHEWGPLVYQNPENDITLTTTNFFCELDENFNITSHTKLDFSKHDGPSIWEFKGLEDARVFRWDGKLYICGVRRDTTTNGVGRMELCETDGKQELTRWRMPAPGDDSSYCEKNWMPILDKPYHFVKWCNPTEIVKVDPENKKVETVHLGQYEVRTYGERADKNVFNGTDYQPTVWDIRGDTHVIKVGKYYVSLCHESRLYKTEQGRKNADYLHLFVVWDENWNVVRYTDVFSLMGFRIEFACGMCEYKGDILISFGVVDNAAYLLRIPMETFMKIIMEV